MIIRTVNPPEAKAGTRRLRSIAAVTVIAAVAVLSACSAPGGSQSSAPYAEVSEDLGSEPITVKMTVATGAEGDYADQTAALFTEKYPNVTFDITKIDFTTLVETAPQLISGANVPDVIQLAKFGNLVKNDLLTNLDEYADLYGWSEWDQSQFASLRMEEGGTVLGSGSLYGIGHGSNIVGVYYNRALADQLGITPPTSVAEFEDQMAAAKAAGILPLIMNGADGLISFPLQQLAVAYADSTQSIQDWIFNKPDATIDTPELVEAAATLQKWQEDGFISPDVVSLDGTAATAQFVAGEGLFYNTGNWSAPAFDASETQTFGFFPFPAAEPGGQIAGMTAANISAIPSAAKNKNAAAAYLNFIQTDPEARLLTTTITGTVPPSVPGAEPIDVEAGTAAADSITGLDEISKANGLMGFMANATQAFTSSTLIPQTQLLIAGKVTPEDFAATLQSDYEEQLTQ
jgi:ABC-type glycerol-3-phosphate transport system substrate-binding protein